MKQARHLWLLAALAALAPACGGGTQKTPPPPAPSSPTNLVLTAVSTCQITLQWTNTATNADHVLIFRSANGGSFTQIATLTPNSTSYSDLGLQPTNIYTYDVYASNRGGKSDPVLEDTIFTNDLFWNSIASTGPGDRAFHSAVYDSTAQRMIVFGGENLLLTPSVLGDLSQLSLPDPLVGPPVWSSMPSSGTPSARAGHSAIYDSLHNRMIVFGGQTQTATVNELWILDLNPATPSWQQILPGSGANNFTGTPPSSRRNHTAVYDPMKQEMTIFGGSSGGTLVTDFELFVLSLPATGPYTWTSPPLSPGFMPIARDLHSAIFDSNTSEIVLFAGHDNDPLNGNSVGGGDGSVLNNELWSLVPNQAYTWNELQIGGSPALREGHTAVYDSLNQRMIILGGGDETFNTLSPPNLFALNLWGGMGWTQMTPFIAGPTGIANHSAIYDSKYSRVVMFGGHPTKTTYTNEAWWIGQ